MFHVKFMRYKQLPWFISKCQQFITRIRLIALLLKCLVNYWSQRELCHGNFLFEIKTSLCKDDHYHFQAEQKIHATTSSFYFQIKTLFVQTILLNDYNCCVIDSTLDNADSGGMCLPKHFQKH